MKFYILLILAVFSIVTSACASENTAKASPYDSFISMKKADLEADSVRVEAKIKADCKQVTEEYLNYAVSWNVPFTSDDGFELRTLCTDFLEEYVQKNLELPSSEVHNCSGVECTDAFFASLHMYYSFIENGFYKELAYGYHEGEIVKFLTGIIADN